jgi:hypothetical protein
MTHTVKFMIFYLFSRASFFTMLYATENSLISFISLSCSSTSHCWRIFYCSRIYYISVYDFLLSRMVIMHLDGGKVLIFSKSFCAFSYASLNQASTAFISISSIKFIQIYMLSSHIFMHSSSSLLIIAIEVISVLPLSSFSSNGVPCVVRDSKYLILV